MKKEQVILNELNEISPLVAGMEPLQTMEVPSGYFNELPTNLISRLNSLDEGSTTSAILEKAGKTNVLTVPTDYFEKLNDSVFLKLRRNKTTTRLFSLPVLKWAAAACVIGLVGYGIYSKFIFTRTENDTDKEWRESYTLSKAIIKNNEFDLTLNQLDDITIIDFLQENGHDVNAALLASIAETEKINDVNEYFCDEENLGAVMNELSLIEKQ